MNFKKKSSKSTESNNIIDVDAKEYFINSANENKEEKNKKNIFATNTMLDHSFESNFNKFTFSKFIKVNMRNTQIHNSSNFLKSCKIYLEKILGIKLINKVTIEKYKIHNDVIVNIQIVVSFNSPVSYGYLDDFKYPSNWFLVPMTYPNKYQMSSKQSQTHNKQNFFQQQNQNINKANINMMRKPNKRK